MQEVPRRHEIAPVRFAHEGGRGTGRFRAEGTGFPAFLLHAPSNTGPVSIKREPRRSGSFRRKRAASGGWVGCSCFTDGHREGDNRRPGNRLQPGGRSSLFCRNSIH